MTDSDEADRDEKIRLRAYRLWEEEGRPAWQNERHWDMAKELVAQEEGLDDTLLPRETGADTPAEPAFAAEVNGDIPGLDDQGDGVAAPAWSALPDSDEAEAAPQAAARKRGRARAGA